MFTMSFALPNFSIFWRENSLTKAKAQETIFQRNIQHLKEIEIDLINPDKTEILLRTSIN